MKYQGSSVTRVPMESSPLVKEILTEKEEYCVGSRKITLPTCSAEDYSETADNRARLSLEVQVTFVRPRVTFQWFPIPGCNFKNRKIKRPVQTSHLPRIFSDVRPIRSHDDSNYALYSTGVSALDCCWT